VLWLGVRLSGSTSIASLAKEGHHGVGCISQEQHLFIVVFLVSGCEHLALVVELMAAYRPQNGGGVVSELPCELLFAILTHEGKHVRIVPLQEGLDLQTKSS